MRPLVSILTPAYNAEKWIADAIRSAMAQTWEPKEIIVVDDGSTDRTLAIARQFACHDVQIVEQQNQGAAAARNTAFSLSHGDYIQWLDADDLLAPDKIARQMAVLDQISNRRTLLSSSFGHFLYQPSRAQFVPTALWCDLAPTEFLLRKLEQKIYMQTAVWLVSRELTLAAGPWDTSMTSDDDGEYFCRVLLASDNVRFVPEARVYYRRVGTAGLSWAIGSDRRLESVWRSIHLHIGYLRSLEDSQRVRTACLTYLQNYVIDFHPQRLDIVAQMRQLAENLGGKLELPRLPWKYSWIKTLFGPASAKRVLMFLPSVKWTMARFYDRALLSRRAEEVPANGGLCHEEHAANHPALKSQLSGKRPSIDPH